MNNGSPIRGSALPVRRSQLRPVVMLFAGVLASLTYVVWVWLAVGRFTPVYAAVRKNSSVTLASR